MDDLGDFLLFRLQYLPATVSSVILCLLQLFKLLPEWIVDDLGDFLLFRLQYLPATVSPVILCLLQLFKLLPEWILDDFGDFLLFGLQYLPAATGILTVILCLLRYICLRFCRSGFWRIWPTCCLDSSNNMCVTAVQAAAGVDSGRSGGFPAVWTAIPASC